MHIIRMVMLGVYEIKIYETPSGNRPFQKFLEKLIQQHKEDEVYKINAYLNKLKELGFDINTKFKPLAIKPLRDDVYELRPSSSRIFFFYFKDGVFIILHGYEKKQNKTDPNEIKKAIAEKKDFIKEQKNGTIN